MSQRLLDHVVEHAGPVAADTTLSVVRSICNWYTTRNEDYVSPIVPGMRRSVPKERAGTRILSDDEIRAVWKQAELNGNFGALIRLLLLTGQRREKVASMKWSDVSVDGTWVIAAEKREKGNAGELVLPEQALEIIRRRPRPDGNPYVLAGQGTTHFKGYGTGKRLFDAKVKIPAWRLHDLRRTARSLLSRAGVSSDHAERVLGHAIRGVEGIYDRHSYRDQKADALRKLAGLIELILNPPADNVVSIAG